MNTQATVFNPFLGCHVTIDLTDLPEWLDLAALYADAAEHGDYDLVATIDTLDETVKQNWKI